MIGIGVYQIRNLVDGKVYIGSTIDAFSSRWGHHRGRLRVKAHCNPKLQNAWNKHGEKCFVFEVVEVCVATECLIREQHYLDVRQPEYNICQVAGNRTGYSHTDVTKHKISKALLGRSLSVEHKHNISNAKQGAQPQHLRAVDRTGSKNGRAVITEAQAREIKVLLSQKLSQQKIAGRFGIQQTLVSRIARGVSWAHA